MGCTATLRTALSRLLREPVRARLNRASLLLAAPVDSAHAQLLTELLSEGGRVLASWHVHDGHLSDPRTMRFERAWRRLTSYERALWGHDSGSSDISDDSGVPSAALDIRPPSR